MLRLCSFHFLKKTLIKTVPSFFVHTSHGLCTKIQPYGTCTQWRTQHTDIQGMHCAFGSGESIQCAKCGGMTAFDGNVNQHAANTSPRNLAVELCMQKKRRKSQLPICGAHLPSISMRPSAQYPVPLIIPGFATACTSVANAVRPHEM